MKLAYISFIPNSKAPHIWIANADGTLPTQIRIGRNPSWSPDSSKLAYTGVAGAGDFITIIDSSVEFIGLSFGSTNNTSGDVVLRAKNFNYFQSIPPTYDFYNLGRDKILTIIKNLL